MCILLVFLTYIYHDARFRECKEQQTLQIRHWSPHNAPIRNARKTGPKATVLLGCVMQICILFSGIVRYSFSYNDYGILAIDHKQGVCLLRKDWRLYKEGIDGRKKRL